MDNAKKPTILTNEYGPIPGENNRLRDLLKGVLNNFYGRYRGTENQILIDWESFGYSSMRSAFYTLQQCIQRENFPLHLFRKNGKIYIERTESK